MERKIKASFGLIFFIRLLSVLSLGIKIAAWFLNVEAKAKFADMVIVDDGDGDVEGYGDGDVNGD